MRTFFTAKVLAKNAPLILVYAAVALERFAQIGLIMFLQKLVHVQFRFTEGDSSLIIGCLIMPGAAIGAFLGGFLVNHHSL